MTPIALLPSVRKPRERLWHQGAPSLSLEELIAVVLGSGSSGRPVFDIASQAAAVLMAGGLEPADFAGIAGIGPAKAAELAAALHIRSAVDERRGRQLLDAPNHIHALCRDLAEQPQEHVAVLYLTVRNGLIARDVVSVGTATASLLHAREVFRPAITRNASHIVLVHTHPSGDPSPSLADREATRRMAAAGRQLDIELVDHVICSAGRYYSFRQECPQLFQEGIS